MRFALKIIRNLNFILLSFLLQVNFCKCGFLIFKLRTMELSWFKLFDRELISTQYYLFLSHSTFFLLSRFNNNNNQITIIKILETKFNLSLIKMLLSKFI